MRFIVWVSQTRSSHMIPEPFFRNRGHAGAWLAEHLRRFRGPETVVLGIPRGGVVVAAEVAHSLGAKLDIAVARKLPAPGQPELAIGAVTPTGGLFLDAELIRWLGVVYPYLLGVIEKERIEGERRERVFRDDAPPHSISGKVAIVVDERGETGAMTRAELTAAGLALALYAGAVRYTVVAAVQRTLAALHQDGSSLGYRDAMATFQEWNHVVGFDDYVELERRFVRPDRPLADSEDEPA